MLHGRALAQYSLKHFSALPADWSKTCLPTPSQHQHQQQKPTAKEGHHLVHARHQPLNMTAGMVKLVSSRILLLPLRLQRLPVNLFQSPMLMILAPVPSPTQSPLLRHKHPQDNHPPVLLLLILPVPLPLQMSAARAALLLLQFNLRMRGYIDRRVFQMLKSWIR